MVRVFWQKKSMKKFFICFLFLILLTSCESAREGFTLKKNDNSDEFLVEKKNPLVMPPEYNDLPIPEDFQNQTKDKDEEEFEKIINNAKNLKTGKGEITSQNHGFAVNREEAELHADLEITHLHLNDSTVAGIAMKNKKCFSVQYHPEASPGPHDSSYLFDDFIELLK